jgi:acetyl esterase/lipase
VTGASRTLALLAGVFAFLIWAPPVTRAIWILRVVATELSLIVALMGALALPGLVRRRDLLFAVPALLAVIVGLMPPLRIQPEFRRTGLTFSWPAYLTWGGGVGRVEVERDIALGAPAASAPLLADVYRVRRGGAEAAKPALVLVHGGGFRGGDKGENAKVSKLFAAAGYVVVDTQYRLAPNHRFPAAASDIKCALRAVRARAAEWGIDPARIAILARSAGAEIAAVAAFSAGDPRIPSSCGGDPGDDVRVAAFVSLYGPHDLAWGWRIRVWPDPLVGYRLLEEYIGGTPETHVEAFELASTRFWVRSPPHPPPPKTLLIHGQRDSLVSPLHNTMLVETFIAKGLDPPRFVSIPWAEHGFDFHPGGFAEQLARGEILRFLKQHL